MAIGVIQTYSFLFSSAGVNSGILRSTFCLISDNFQFVSWKTRTELKDSVGTGTLELFVRFGKTFTVSVGQSATVKTLKKQIQIKTGISVTDQVLTTGSRYMVDRAKLSCYNLCNNTTLHLTLRLRGGCDTKKQKLDQKAASFEKKDVEFIDLLDTDSDCDSDSPLFSDPVESITEQPTNGFSSIDERQYSSSSKLSGDCNNIVDDGLSEYERLRLRNIERNQRRLASLGLLSAEEKRSTHAISTAATSTTSRKRKDSSLLPPPRRSLPRRRCTMLNRTDSDSHNVEKHVDEEIILGDEEPTIADNENYEPYYLGSHILDVHPMEELDPSLEWDFLSSDFASGCENVYGVTVRKDCLSVTEISNESTVSSSLTNDCVTVGSSNNNDEKLTPTAEDGNKKQKSRRKVRSVDFSLSSLILLLIASPVNYQYDHLLKSHRKQRRTLSTLMSWFNMTSIKSRSLTNSARTYRPKTGILPNITPRYKWFTNLGSILLRKQILSP